MKPWVWSPAPNKIGCDFSIPEVGTGGSEVQGQFVSHDINLTGKVQGLQRMWLSCFQVPDFFLLSYALFEVLLSLQ